MIWGVGEVTVTIIAASIPVLRSLIKDIGSSNHSDVHNVHARYIRSKSIDKSDRGPRLPPQEGLNIVVVSALRRSGSLQSLDGDSDKSILNSSSKKIIKTEEVQINFADRGDSDAFEMKTIPKQFHRPL
jgi:hypothetical protein